MEEIDYTERTCIIVVEIEGETGTDIMGIVVDSVSEVLTIKVIVILACVGAAASLFVSIFMYTRTVNEMHGDARAKADVLLSEAVEMFMVSTRKFHEDFQKTNDDPVGRKKIQIIVMKNDRAHDYLISNVEVEPENLILNFRIQRTEQRNHRKSPLPCH